MANKEEPLLTGQNYGNGKQNSKTYPILSFFVLAAILLVVGVLLIALFPAGFNSPIQQESATIHIGKQQLEPTCECLEWKTVYKKYGVECSAGGELQPIVDRAGIPLPLAKILVGDEFCNKFFKRIPDNFCVNDKFDYNPQQWCYVSPACPGTHISVHSQGLFGSYTNTKVVVKYCGDGDKMLKDYSFDKLIDLTKTENENLDLGLLSQYAYKQWTKDKWPAVSEEIIHDVIRSDLKDMVASNKPVFIDSESDHPPFYIVKGNTVEEIHFKSNWETNFVLGRMGDVNEMVCIKGCNNSTSRA